MLDQLSKVWGESPGQILDILTVGWPKSPRRFAQRAEFQKATCQHVHVLYVVVVMCMSCCMYVTLRTRCSAAQKTPAAMACHELQGRYASRSQTRGRAGSLRRLSPALRGGEGSSPPASEPARRAPRFSPVSLFRLARPFAATLRQICCGSSFWPCRSRGRLSPRQSLCRKSALPSVGSQVSRSSLHPTITATTRSL